LQSFNIFPFKHSPLKIIKVCIYCIGISKLLMQRLQLSKLSVLAAQYQFTQNKHSNLRNKNPFLFKEMYFLNKYDRILKEYHIILSHIILDQFIILKINPFLFKEMYFSNKYDRILKEYHIILSHIILDQFIIWD